MKDLVTRSFDVAEIDSKLKLCDHLAKSKLVPRALQDKPEDIFVVLQYGYELDLPPIQSLSSIYVVNGTPVSSGQLMLALIYRDCPNAIIEIDKEMTDKGPKVSCLMMRSPDHKGYIATWDMARANSMGISGKDNWRKQPGTMLRWRAVAEAARTIFPDIIKGLYIDDEIEEKNTFKSTARRRPGGATEETKQLTSQLLTEPPPVLVEPVKETKPEVKKSKPSDLLTLSDDLLDKALEEEKKK